MADYYDWFKALHVISVISWMAGLFYLPRLYVYHTRATKGSEMDKTFVVMEKKLLRIIMNPAMISSYFFGLMLVYIYGLEALGIWFHIKLLAIIVLTIFHMLLARFRRAFEEGRNNYSETFYRYLNEVPTIMMIIAVIMVIVKPFE